jgi:hypothetical protein
LRRGEAGWQGIYPKRFSRPDVQFAQQINIGQTGSRGLIMDAETCKALSDANDARHGKRDEPKNTGRE